MSTKFSDSTTVPGTNRNESLYKQLRTAKQIAPDGYACHTCDNPYCVNPNHLYEGDVFTNARDRIKRGRHRGGNKPGYQIGSFQMNNHPRIFDDHEIEDIRRRLEAKESRMQIALSYNVSYSLITKIANRTSSYD